MEVETLQITEHRGCPVLIQRIGNVFQYIVVYQGQFYAKHNVITLPIFRSKYTPDELHNSTRVVMTQAKTTIEFLMQNKK